MILCQMTFNHTSVQVSCPLGDWQALWVPGLSQLRYCLGAQGSVWVIGWMDIVNKHCVNERVWWVADWEYSTTGSQELLMMRSFTVIGQCPVFVSSLTIVIWFCEPFWLPSWSLHCAASIALACLLPIGLDYAIILCQSIPSSDLTTLATTHKLSEMQSVVWTWAPQKNQFNPSWLTLPTFPRPSEV
jgi:hypothetical protein